MMLKSAGERMLQHKGGGRRGLEGGVVGADAGRGAQGGEGGEVWQKWGGTVSTSSHVVICGMDARGQEDTAGLRPPSRAAAVAHLQASRHHQPLLPRAPAGMAAAAAAAAADAAAAMPLLTCH